MQNTAQLVRDRLRTIALGLLASLNSKAFSKYQTDFPQLFVEKPVEAYKVLLEVAKSPTKARVILRSLLLPLAGDTGKAFEAIRALEEGDEKRFKEILGWTS